MIDKLFHMKKWKEWDIQIDNKPQSLESRKLAAPKIIMNDEKYKNKDVFANERVLKQLPVYNKENLTNRRIIIIYDRRSSREADDAIEAFNSCQKMVGININFPKLEKCELVNANRNSNEVKSQIKSYLDKNGISDRSNVFAVVILDSQYDYQKYKNALSDLGLLS